MSSNSEILRNNLCLWGVLLWLMSLVSCVEEMELPEGFYQESLVINSVLDPDSLVRVNVSRSMTPNGTVSIDFIENASVGIDMDDQVGTGSLLYEGQGWYENDFLEVKAMSGYSLTAECPDMMPVRANCVVPAKPKIEDVALRGNILSFRIVDDPEEDNYYLVRTFAWMEEYTVYMKEDGTWEGYSDTIYKLKENESDLEYIEAWYSSEYGWVNSITGFTFDDEFWSMNPDYEADSYVFSDRMFNGQTIDFQMDISYALDHVVGDPPVIDLFVHALDENYFRYLITLAQYLTTYGTPFTERAKVHNNIEDGLGVFGAQNGVKFEVALTE